VTATPAAGNGKRVPARLRALGSAVRARSEAVDVAATDAVRLRITVRGQMGKFSEQSLRLV